MTTTPTTTPISKLFAFVPPSVKSPATSRPPAKLPDTRLPNTELPDTELPDTEGISTEQMIFHILARCLVDNDFTYLASQSMLADDWHTPENALFFKVIQAVWAIDELLPTREAIYHYIAENDMAERLSTVPISALFRIRVGPSQAEAYMKTLLLESDSRQVKIAAIQIYDWGDEKKANAIEQGITLMERLAERRQTSNLTQLSAATAQLTDSIMAGGDVDMRIVMTGMNSIDRPLVGLHPGRLMVLTMPTGEGKTGFGLNLAGRVARFGECAVYYASQEQTEDEIARIMLSQWTGRHVPWMLYGPEPPLRPSISPVRMLLLQSPLAKRTEIIRILREIGELVSFPALTDAESAEICNAQAHIEQMNMVVDDKCHSTELFRANTRFITRRNPNSFILAVNDHMHVAEEDDEGSRRDSSADRLSRIAGNMKRCALADMNGRGSVLAMAQLNRTADTALARRLPGAKPETIFSVSQIKGSSDIEQNADTIMFGHRLDRRLTFEDEGYTLLPGWGIMETVVRKNRQTGFLRADQMYVNTCSFAITNTMYPIEQI